jgi:hypothetical protein
MRKPDVQLIARARRGDIAACLEAGRKYLEGASGFPRHVTVGLQYLQQAESHRAADVQRLIVESMNLYEIASHGRVPTLRQAAHAGRVSAQLKMAVWSSLAAADDADSSRWFRRAAAAGDDASARVLAQSPEDEAVGTPVERLRALKELPCLGWTDLLGLAMDRALMRRDAKLLFRTLSLCVEDDGTPDPVLADKVFEALSYASSLPSETIDIDRRALEGLLEDCVSRGNGAAALMLGQALSGIDVGNLHWQALVPMQNFRKASALLMRAADSGHGEAWTRLYEIHSNHNGSVANPSMARFCLEKAAAAGVVSAQRRLGATILRASGTLREVEQGMHWLFLAAQAGDEHANKLMQTFVLPVLGAEDDAARALIEIQRTSPVLAIRLRVARDFGLTKLEAMTVDLPTGMRPWGLVVGRNPFIRQARLSSPRAVPATSLSALEGLRGVVAQITAGGVRGASSQDFDLRHRALRIRQVLAAHGLEESMFFAKVRSRDLDVLRGGARWARSVKSALDDAMAHEAAQTLRS